MRGLVVYDSVYGNTQRIAEAIGSGIGEGAEVVKADRFDRSKLDSTNLLVIGSPTQGGRPTKSVQEFIDGIPETVARSLKVAAFDTRYSGRFVKVFGFAADRIAQRLTLKGGTLVGPPQGFFVGGKKGPLKEGEETRAREWGKSISK